MTDLWDYFILAGITKELGIYEKYNDMINDIELNNNSISLKVYDVEEAFSQFKQLIQPEGPHTSEDCVAFILICYYLNSLGYYIEQFPDYLARPTNLKFFADGNIKEKAREIYGVDYKGCVTWKSRKEVIKNLTIKINGETLVKTKPKLDEIFKKISNRNVSFDNMENNEKLQEICNVIENMLKINGEFMKIEYGKNTFELIQEEDVKRFRKMTQCFRHASEESIIERNKFSDEEKDFCINYGLTICQLIFNSIK